MGRKEQMALRTAVTDRYLFEVRRSESRWIDGCSTEVSADGTLDGWSA